MKSLYHRITTPAAQFVRQWHWFLAGGLLVLMFSLSLGAMAGDSAIVDEVAHIPAAYSYLHFGDYRLNPEHPPLIKNLAGLPLQFMHLKFPTTDPSWTTEANGQWDAGWAFLYHLGNNAQAILFWARLPILLLAIGFGLILYRFVLGRWGKAAALLTLFFYTLSPDILGHDHFVTTDLGASIFIFLALITYVKFVERPLGRNLLLLSLGLAAAQLAKFSGFLLYPVLLLVSIGVVATWQRPRRWAERAKLYLGGLVTASALSFAWIWIYYIPNVINMPISVQDRLISGSLLGPNVAGIANFLTWLSHWTFFKPIVQYALGLTMVFGRVEGGNVTYLNGQVTDQSFKLYFPELFVAKTQVAFLILGLIAAGVGIYFFIRHGAGLRQRLSASCRNHFLAWTLGLFAAFYFAVSVAGNLNLGIRHILPIYVPLFVLVAVSTVATMRSLIASRRWRTISTIVLALLLAWYAASTLWAYPSFTAYFNELIGGPANADKYFSDSGIDWGQDLVRLQQYVKTHPQIKHLALDYFGGGLPQYYFCHRTYDSQGRLLTDGTYDCSNSVYEFWHAQYGPYTGQYLAVSETFLENDRYYAAQRGDQGYAYLRKLTPIAKIGYSIYLYKLY